MMDLKGRVAVVSGGASGIGAACVELLRARGSIAVSWDVAEGADVKCDTSSEQSVIDALIKTERRFGVPSVHVASAGVRGFPAPVVEIPVAAWDATFAVNVRGVFLTGRTIARRMMAAGLDGAIVNLSSVQGVVADPSLALYSSTKAAVLQFTRVAAIEWGPHGIRVNAVGPGPTLTAMTRHLADDPTWATEVEQVTPLRKVGTAELVAEAIVNLLQTEWITGQVILADGGSSLISARGANRARIHAAELASNS